MPFVDIRIAGTATRAQKSAIVADVTVAISTHLGKPASAVQVNIIEVSTENYGVGGVLLADRMPSPAQEVASANGER